MNTAIRIDTEQLRLHREILLDEYRAFLELANHLRNAQELSPDDLKNQFRPLINKSEELARYSYNMSESLEEICCRFERISKQIAELLENQIAQNSGAIDARQA